MNQSTPYFPIMTYLDQQQTGLFPPDEQASILIVESNPDHWTLIRLALQQLMPDITVIWCSNPATAMNCLADCIEQHKELPKVIVMDIYLPRRENGLDLLQFLKESGSPYNHLPVIAFSFSTLPEDIMDAYERGVNAYTIKSPDYRQWLGYFTRLRDYWLETVALPKLS